MKYIIRSIWVLSLISLFTDVASEMLYPIMPVYLKTIGFSIILIGILEGFAEAIAGISKGYFGSLSDGYNKRLPFIQIGYALSAISKPLMAVFVYPIWIFFARTIDRLGKGIRTSARDALLSDLASPSTKGRVFGFHRSMDTLGAAIGPFVALIFFAYYPGHYKQLFLLAFGPGLVAIVLTFLIKEKRKNVELHKVNVKFLDFFRYWKTANSNYKALVRAMLLFSLFNSSDIFLLLKIKQAGFSDTILIEIYIFYNLVYAFSSYPVGILADRSTMKKVLIGGFVVFALVYIAMAYVYTIVAFFIVFFLYGVYAAATEGVAKAWISNLCETNKTATAIGIYTAFQSIAALLASSIAGILWFSFGPKVSFVSSAVAAIFVAALIFKIKPFAKLQ